MRAVQSRGGSHRRTRPSRVRRLRVRKAIGNLSLAGAVVFVASMYVVTQKSVTLVVQGQQEAVRTMSANVGQLLDAQGIEVGERALVFPPEATPLADGMTVVVEHRFYSPALDVAAASLETTAPQTTPSTDVGAWVLEGVDGSATMLAARSTEDWFSAVDPAGRPNAVAADVVVMGKDHDVLTNATSVGQLLSAMGITPDRNDRVLPSPSAPLHDGQTVRYVSVDYRLHDITVPIPYTTATTVSDLLEPGDVRVTQQGADGVMRETYRVKLVDDAVVARALLTREVLDAATPERRLVGRREVDAVANAGDNIQVGEASWYSFAPGSGLTAAHPWLPFGTVVTVTNLANGRSVQVVINDRGPFGGRIIDLSDEAFARIAPLGQGVANVRLTW
jgi:resuscitation-promoting factor RpfB